LWEIVIVSKQQLAVRVEKVNEYPVGFFDRLEVRSHFESIDDLYGTTNGSPGLVQFD
jgi:hypothetical protein